MSTKEAKERLESDKSIILLDVREEGEYLEKHIPNSINLPLGKIDAVEKIVPDKNTTVFTSQIASASWTPTVEWAWGY